MTKPGGSRHVMCKAETLTKLNDKGSKPLAPDEFKSTLPNPVPKPRQGENQHKRLETDRPYTALCLSGVRCQPRLVHPRLAAAKTPTSCADSCSASDVYMPGRRRSVASART